MGQKYTTFADLQAVANVVEIGDTVTDTAFPNVSGQVEGTQKIGDKQGWKIWRGSNASILPTYRAKILYKNAEWSQRVIELNDDYYDVASYPDVEASPTTPTDDQMVTISDWIYTQKLLHPDY